MWHDLARPFRRRIRLLVGLLLAGLFCVQCSPSIHAGGQSNLAVPVAGKMSKSGAEEVAGKVERLARNDHIALLKYCLEKYEGRYRDYTCTLTKQERINGQLGEEQEARCKFLAEPFSVLIHFVRNVPLGEKIIYIEGKYNGQMLVQPRGWMGSVFGTVMRDPEGPEALKNTLRPITEFGFKNSLQDLLKVYRQARRAGDLQPVFAGHVELNGRTAAVLVRHLPPENEYPAARTVIYLDTEYLIPVRVEGYGWDDQFICRYDFSDLEFNTGLAPSDFLPQANGMEPPQ